MKHAFHIKQFRKAATAAALALITAPFGNTIAGVVTPVIHDAFQSWIVTNVNWVVENVNGRLPDGANLPGGLWQALAQYDWAQPIIYPASHGQTPHDAVYMGEQITSINIPLAGYNSGRLRISANIRVYEQGDASAGAFLGFSSQMPEGVETNMWHGWNEHIKPHLNGLGVHRSGRVNLIVGGQAAALTQIPGVNELPMNQMHNLCYDIDTADGSVGNIRVNGVRVPPFETDAFTQAAAAYATFACLEGTKSMVDDFIVSALDDEEGAPALAAEVSARGVLERAPVVAGTLIGGNVADIYLIYGAGAADFASTNLIGRKYEGIFECAFPGNAPSAEYHYQFMASNSLGVAFSGEGSFITPGAAYTWGVSPSGGVWADENNWDGAAAGFPDAPRTTATVTGTVQTIFLNQPRTTLGGLEITPVSWNDYTQDIAPAAPGNALVFDYADGPAFIKMTGLSWGGAKISADIVLSNDLHVATATQNTSWGLGIAGGVSGPGKIVGETTVVNGATLSALIAFMSPGEQTYESLLTCLPNAAHLTRQHPGVTRITGVNTFGWWGNWDDASGIVRKGGTLIFDGGSFTNNSSSTRGVLFRDNGNTLVMTNGVDVFFPHGYQHMYSGPFNEISGSSNNVIIAGAGTEWRMSGSVFMMNGQSNTLTVADGALMRGMARFSIGESGGDGNTVFIRGEGAGVDLGRGSFSVGKSADANPAAQNTAVIEDGARLENAWISVGGYYNGSNGGGISNSIIVRNGGRVSAGSANNDDGLGSMIGAAGNANFSETKYNSALVTGAGSAWDNGGRPFTIGAMFEPVSTGGLNRATAADGGAITNISRLFVGFARNYNNRGFGFSYSNALTLAEGGLVRVDGDVAVGAETLNNMDALEPWGGRAIGNTIEIAGGRLAASNLVVNPQNALSPVLGMNGMPDFIRLSGVAEFGGGAYVSPGKIGGPKAEAKEGIYTFLEAAGGVIEPPGGLHLNPDLENPELWRLIIQPNALRIIYSKPATMLLVR